MSYLDPLRLHFAGRFQASPSTVNNDPLHYDSRHFLPSYQERMSGSDPSQWNGWWNPLGDGAWRMLGCRVTAAWRADGSPAPEDDPVLGSRLADSDRQVAAKLVDLDPQQQLVSQIWGLELRIVGPEGRTRLRGLFKPAAFMDIWDRSSQGQGDGLAGAYFQSVLTDLDWDHVDDSPFLVELQARADSDLLSIKFNIDGYSMDVQSPEFCRGRVVGTLGPANSDEPRHFVRGRQFLTTGLPIGTFFVPAGRINFCTARVDQESRKVFLDLGNALPTTKPGGGLVDLGPLSLAYSPADPTQPAVTLGVVPYTQPGFYERTAGVVALPEGRTLSDSELAAIAANPLVLLVTYPGGQTAPGIREAPGGLYVRADQFVYRLEPGDSARVRLFATQYGQPLVDARVLSFLDPNGLQMFSLLGTPPPVGTPASAIDFPGRVESDDDGVATLVIRARDPENPRGFIDGQVYGVRSALEETLPPSAGYPFSPWHFVSLLVFDAYEAEEPPSWYGSIQTLLQQYANLYPIMKRLLSLDDYDGVRAKRRLLRLVFDLFESDPNSMPVTRDLSPSKRRAILRWLADDPPLRGSPPSPAPSPAQTDGVATEPAVLPAFGPESSKALASSTRIGHSHRR
jgi:hypothetical protein